VLQYVAVCCSVLQCVAVCCSVLQCVAVWCSVVQCVAVCFNVLPFAVAHPHPQEHSLKNSITLFFTINHSSSQSASGSCFFDYRADFQQICVSLVENFSNASLTVVLHSKFDSELDFEKFLCLGLEGVGGKRH